MTVALRPYQADAVERVRDAYRSGARAPLLVAPTGAGKTVMFSYVAATSTQRGRSVLVLAHRRELIRQASQKLAAAGVPHGIIAPGHTMTRDACQVGSVQTVTRRMARVAPPDLIVIDEAHHAVAGQWADVVRAFPAARILGVTATPERLDGRGLGVEAGGPFDALVLGPTIGDLMQQGHLTPCRVFAPAEAPDLRGVRTVRGDYDTHALSDAMARPKLVGDAVAHYAKHAPGLPAILFSPSVAHAEAMAAAFREAGWRAVAASGSTPTPERDAAISGLATGAVQVLCSCDLISEGLDVPSVGAVILMRPTKSLGLYVQQVGRGLRPAPGKDALIVLDHAGNTLTHGLPDTPREWTLAGREKRGRDKDAEAPVRQCEECFAMYAAAAKACPECGHVPEEKLREINHVEGDLAEVSQDQIQHLRATPLRKLMAQAKTREELALIARARGYKPGWVYYVSQERERAKRKIESIPPYLTPEQMVDQHILDAKQGPHGSLPPDAPTRIADSILSQFPDMAKRKRRGAA